MKDGLITVLVLFCATLVALMGGFGFVAIAGRGEWGAVLPLAFLYLALRSIEIVVTQEFRRLRQRPSAG